MKHAKVILLLFTFLFIFGSMNISGNNVFVLHEDTSNVKLNENVMLSYDSHDVISIIGDAAFEAQAADETWPGDGSSDTPYIIQGYNITNDTSLSIEIIDVSLYFEIRDCLIISTTHENVGGVTLSNVTHAHLENCIIAYKNTGLGIHNSDGITVVNCTMDNNAAGVTVDSSNHTSFEKCYFTQTTTGSGFYQDSSYWTSITESYLNFNGDYGLESYWSDYFVFNDNEVTGNDYAGLLVENSHYGEYQRNTVFGNYEEGIILFDSHRATVTNNIIYDNDRYGLDFVGSENAVVSFNFIYNNTLDGINFDTGGHSVIENNIVYKNGWTNFHLGGTACGIVAENADNFTIIRNDVYNNTQHGILLDSTSGSVIHDNTVWGNHGVMGECGISINNAFDSNITSNTVYNNTENGIDMSWSDDCIVSHNIIYDNTMVGLRLHNCNRTLIYYNDIGWNDENGYSSVGSTYINYWDNGVVGNWWSNYNGTGPYNISGPTGEYDMHPSNSLELGFAPDIYYEGGSTGNTITVEAQALNPWYFEVFSGNLYLDQGSWDGGDITASVDGLPLGLIAVTIRVFHVSGHEMARISAATVVDTTAPEWLTTPTNQTLEFGEALNYQIQVTDFSEIDEWIVNDTVHFNIVDGLLTNTTALQLGDYALNITVVDIHGNARSVEIIIHVVVSIPHGGNGTALLLIVGGIAAAAVIIIVLVVIIKKKAV